MATSQNGKIEGITNKLLSDRGRSTIKASLACGMGHKWRKTAQNAGDGSFLAISLLRIEFEQYTIGYRTVGENVALYIVHVIRDNYNYK